MENNFCKAYFEAFHGNNDLKYDWRRYLSMVYIRNNGDVKTFDFSRSLKKFYTLITNDTSAKRLRNTLASIIRSHTGTEFVLYSEFANERESYLNAHGDRYRYIYAV